MVLKTLESPLDCKEIQPVCSKENQSWMFIVKTNVETETPILWPTYAKNWFFCKYPDVGKDWRLEEKWTTEDKKVGWHHRLNEHEYESTLGVSDEQGSLACCSPWSRIESDTVIDWTENWMFHIPFVWIYSCLLNTEAWHQVIHLNTVLYIKYFVCICYLL